MIYDIKDERGRLVGSVEASTQAEVERAVRSQLAAGTREPTYKQRERLDRMKFDDDPRVYYVQYLIHEGQAWPKPFKAREVGETRIVADGKLTRKQLTAKILDRDLGPVLKVLKVRQELLDSMGRPRRGIGARY
jgi:hypothetical protein